MALNDVEQRRATVLKEVPTIGNVDGLGSTAATTIRKTGAAIAGDDFNARMVPQPSSEAVRLTIRQEIDDPPLLKVDQNGAVGMAAAAGFAGRAGSSAPPPTARPSPRDRRTINGAPSKPSP